MKKISLIFGIITLGLWCAVVWAQTKPKLVDISFYVNGKPGNQAGYGNVTVELMFDKAMKITVDPKINYGLLGESYPLNLPVRGQWEHDRLWQGSFTITDNVPSTNDGEYVFKIYDAVDTSNVPMDTTFSLDVDSTSLLIGRSGELGVSANSLLFGTIREGRSKDLSLVLNNTSYVDLHVSNIAIAPPFSIVSGFTATTIPANGHVVLTVRFFPSTRAVFTQNMVIYSDDRRHESVSVSLSGSAFGAKIILSPSNSIDFGWVRPDSSARRSILVANQPATNPILSDTLRISEITTTDAKIFQGSLSTLTLAPGDTKSVVITFTPKEFRSYTNYKVNFSSNDETQSLRSVFLSGDAMSELEVSTDSLFFGNIREGRSKDLSLTLTNTNSKQLNIFSIAITAPFSIVNGYEQMTIPGNGSIVLTLRFFPSSRAVYTQTMTINSSDQRQGTHSIFLSGSAIGPKIILSPGNSIDYGRVMPDSSARRSILVSNQPVANPILNDTLRISNISTTDANIFHSSLSQLTIAPGDTKSVVVTFTPREYKTYSNYKINFSSNDETQPLRSVFLNGNAKDEIPPPPISELRITWSGRYGGYFNGSWLGICWDNPNDPSGIAEVRWKFTKTLSPPTSPDDTTRYGGRYILKIGESCVSLPIFGRLSAGRWYCYMWLVDRSGNSGYLNSQRTYLVYDTTPPGKPTLVSRSLPDSVWFGRTSVFTLTITVPSDPVLKYADAAEVRWKYKSKPGTGTDSEGYSPLSRNSKNQATFTVPFNSSSLCGEDTLFYWLADSAGNSSADSVAIAKYRFDMCPPVFSRPAPLTRNIALLGQAFKDTLMITDDSGVDSVWAFYRFGGAVANEPPQILTRISRSDSFVVQIPKEGISRRGIEYRVIARDSLSNEGSWPNHASPCELDSSWFAVRTRVEGEGDFRIDASGRPVPLLAGGDEDSYQLFSVPYDLDKKTPDDVLADDLGPYKIEDWRIFDYDPVSRDTTKWLEGKNARPFTPGHAYFVVTRKSDIVVDGGPGQTRRTICPDTVRLYDGWNLIADPFNFPVPKSALSLLHAHSQNFSLHSYERGWNLTDHLEPWSGYAIYVTSADTLYDTTSTPIYLVVRPQAVSARIGKFAESPFVLQNEEWLLHISAEAGNRFDNDNWLGLRLDATDALDTLELAEPPVIGKYVQVAFPHPEWRQSARLFSSDLRRAGSEDQVWNCEVTTNQPNTLVKLNFAFLGQVPADKEVYLFDETAGVALNLKSNSTYTFKSAASGGRKMFKLVAGSKQFAQTQAKDISLVPDRFALIQNYPNPFNSETVIRFNLPQSAAVRLVIYDMQGRTVRTLLDNLPHNAGYHSVIWDGTDDANKEVATGVYLFKIFAGDQTQSQKMIFLK